MAWIDNFKNALHPYDDEYIENEAAAAEEAFDDFVPRREKPYNNKTAPKEPVYEEPAPPPRYEEQTKPRRKTQVYQSPAQDNRSNLALKSEVPVCFEDASGIADALLRRQPIILSLDLCDDNTARRLLDFLSGVAYALDGNMRRISGKVFSITPNNIDFIGNTVDDLEASGIKL